MKVIEKKILENDNRAKIKYNPALDDLVVPDIVLKKTERAREFLKKHPIPENIASR